MVTKVSALRELIVESFNLEEIRTLCYDLRVSYDDLQGEGITAKSRELIAYLERRDRLDQLITYLENARSDLREELAAIELLPATSLRQGLARLSNRRQTLLGVVAVIIVLAIAAYLVLGSHPAAPVTPDVTVSPAVVLTPTSTLSPTPTVTSTPTPVPTPTPVFVAGYIFDEADLFWDVELVELEAEPDVLPSETITDFLRLSRYVLGTFEDDDAYLYEIVFRIKNTGLELMILDLDARYFVMEDEFGRGADIVGFCCDAAGDILAGGQERKVQAIFRLRPEWVSKEGPSVAFVRVRGFLPVVRSSWLVPLPVMGE